MTKHKSSEEFAGLARDVNKIATLLYQSVGQTPRVLCVNNFFISDENKKNRKSNNSKIMCGHQSATCETT